MNEFQKQVCVGLLGLGCCLAACGEGPSDEGQEQTTTVSSELVGQPTTIGVFRREGPQPRQWLLRGSNSEGPPNYTYHFPASAFNGIPIVGDWDGNGIVTAGYVELVGTQWRWHQRNTNDPTSPWRLVVYGDTTQGDDWPVAGDWDGNGTTTVGFFSNRPDGLGEWRLRNSNTFGPPNVTFLYGLAGDWPIVGDWDGNRTTTVGVARRVGGNWFWLLRNSNTAGIPHMNFSYGSSDLLDYPVVGDWNGNGDMTIGVVRPEGTLLRWLLRNSNTAGNPNLSFRYGLAQAVDTPVTGIWAWTVH
jgi:hypothetical protein